VRVYAFVRSFADEQIDLEQDCFARFGELADTPEERDAFFKRPRLLLLNRMNRT